MTEFIKYPSTPSFKDVVASVKKLFGKRVFIGLTEDKTPIFEETKLPEVTLYGTCKLHGTHGDIYLDGNNELVIQSRNRIITIEDDNQGFARFVTDNKEYFKDILEDMAQYEPNPVISGEWAGGNIQGGVALTGMDKKFFVFSDTDFVSSKDIIKLDRLWNITLKVDLNNLQETQELLEKYTLEVEANCPIGTLLNPNRTNNVGEGIVWKFTHEGKKFFFKTKGEQHKRDNKIVKPKVELPEELKEELNKFLETNVTVDRLEQGIEYLREMNLPISHQSIGTYIKWVTTDTYKESQVDLEALAKLNIDWTKNIAKVVSAMAKAYLVETISKEA